MLRFIVLSSLLLAVLGCGSESSGPRTVDASGVVTLDGVPVEKAQVIFVNSESQTTASATTDAKGRFSLFHNGEKEGAVPGSYKAQVSKTLLESQGDGSAEVTINHALPKKYSSYITADLSYTIPEDGIQDLTIELSSK